MMKSVLDLRNRIASILVENDTALAPDADPPKKKRTKTRSKSNLDMNLEDPTSKGQVSPPKSARPPASKAPPGDVGGAEVLRGAPLSPEAAQHLGDLANSGIDTDGEMSDEEWARQNHRPATAGVEPVPPRPPENLPAVISRAVTSTEGGEPQGWRPQWMQVRDTPGMFAKMIRVLGRRIFGDYTETPLEDIYVMANPFAGTRHDIDMMSKWIRRYGALDTESIEYDFSDIMPGYTADASLWSVEGYQFLLVRDQMGQYIYAWPGGRGTQIEAKPPAQLESAARALVRRLIEDQWDGMPRDSAGVPYMPPTPSSKPRKPRRQLFDEDAKQIADYIVTHNLDYDEMAVALIGTSQSKVKANIVRKACESRSPEAVARLCRSLIPEITFKRFLEAMSAFGVIES